MSRLTLSPYGSKRAFTWASSPSTTMGASKMIYEPVVHLARTMHLLASKLALSPNGRNEIPHDPHHLLVPSCAPKLIFELVVRSAQTMHLSCTNTTLSPDGPKWGSTWPASPRSSIRYVQNDFRASSTFSANCGPILHQHWYYVQTDRNRLPHDLRHLAVPSCAWKTICEPMVRSTQTVHLLASKPTFSRNGSKWAST
jgi:hypothetical protein